MGATQADIKSIFGHAMSLSSDQERAAYLQQACAGNLSLRAEIEALLQADREAGSFLGEREPRSVATVDDPIHERPGTMIGPYKLLEEIGEGGMGLVFVAEQQEPIKRRVALKIIRPGMDSRQVIARFEAERQALALMDHPHIAKVHDGGTTQGRPYFVMEWVKGTPITEYSDEHRLSNRQRLELFLDVCHAVQHAHQKGIIHRDLKPSNVLVEVHDVRPVVKVIDFGIAKATGQQLTDKTVYTTVAQMVGTPLYMSPEQAGLSSLDVDTRSDVYSLGVLLYELLTGTTPFDREQFKKASYDEMRRIVREDEPPRPSTRLSTTEQAELSTIAERRGLEPRGLSQQVRGELDWIVMKALEKDRNRRYETANGLAMDVQRYLNDEPVVACPPSAAYRLRKFVSRNKRMLMSVGAITASLVVGLAVAVVLLVTHAIAMQEEQKKTGAALEQAQGNLTLALEALDDVYMRETKDRVRQDKRMTEAHRESVRKGLRFYERFAKQNAGHEELQGAIAKAYRRAGFLRMDLGDWSEAQAAFAKAVAILEKGADEVHGSDEDQYELARCCFGLTWALREAGQDREAAPICRRAIALCEKLSAQTKEPNPRLVLAHCLDQWARIMSSAHQPDKAEEAVRQVLGLLESLVAEYPPEPLSRPKGGSSERELGDSLRSGSPPRTECVEGLGFAARDLAFMLPGDRSEEKVALFRKGAVAFGKLAAAHPDVPDFLHFQADTHRYIGDVLSALKRDEEAEKAYRKALDLFQKLPGGKFAPGMQRIIPEEVAAYSALANFLMARKRSEDAAAVLRQASAVYGKFPNDPDNLWALGLVRGRLHGLLQELGQKEEAAKAFREAVAIWEKLTADFPTKPEYRQHAADGYRDLAYVLRSEDQRKETCIREALRLYKALAADYPKEPSYRDSLARSRYNLAWLSQELGQPKEAAKAFREAIAIWEKLAADFPGIPVYRGHVAYSYKDLATVLRNDEKGKETSIREALQLFKALAADYPKEPSYRVSVGYCHWQLGDVLRTAGRKREATESYQQAVLAYGSAVTQEPAHPFYRQELGHAYLLFGGSLRDSGQTQSAKEASSQEAAAAYRQGLPIHQSLVDDFPANTFYQDRLSLNYEALIQVLKSARQVHDAQEVLVRARKFYEKVGAAHPNEPGLRDGLARSRYNLAWLSQELGQPKEAAKAFREAIAIWEKLAADFPGIPVYRGHVAYSYKDLVTVLRNDGQTTEAIKSVSQSAALVEKLVRDFPDVQRYADLLDYAHGELVTIFIVARRFREAEKFYSEAIKLNPKDAMLWFRRAESYNRLGLWDRAAKDSAAAFKLQPPATPLQCLGGALLSLYLGDLDSYRQLCTLMPRRFRQEADYGGWENGLSRSCTTGATPESVRAWAVQRAEKSVQADPNGPWNHSALGRARFRTGEYKQAITQLQRSLQVDPNWCSGGQNYPVLAMAYHHQGQREKAKEALAKAGGVIDHGLDMVTRVPTGTLPMLWWDWLECCLLYREAKTLIDGAPPADDPRALVARAHAFAALGDHDKAEEACRDAMQLGAKALGISLACARFHAGLSRWDKVIADLAGGVEAASDKKLLPDFYYLRATAKVQLGRFDEAVADYTKAQELAADNPQVHNDLAWLLVACPESKFRDPQRAVALAQRAVKLAPKAGSYSNTLGLAYYRAGNWKAAVQSLDKSRELGNGGTAFDFLFLAMSHWQLGQKDEALTWYKQAAQWMEKNKEPLAKNPQWTEELRRFRAEAKELLNVKE